MEEKTQAEARLRRTESPSSHVGEREGRRHVEEQVLAQTRVKVYTLSQEEVIWKTRYPWRTCQTVSNPIFQRLFRFFQIFAFNLAYMSSWEGTAVYLPPSLPPMLHTS